MHAWPHAPPFPFSPTVQDIKPKALDAIVKRYAKTLDKMSGSSGSFAPRSSVVDEDRDAGGTAISPGTCPDT